jgi:tetratricopeptide (TPR) repeat protein
MNLTPILHLCWKEYRSIRLFWLAIIILALLMELTLATLLTSENTKQLLVWNIALGAPAFFAIGCAGASFAAEREEGTFDFLRAAPISSLQVFISKLAVTALAAAVMYAVLWPLSALCINLRTPDAAYLMDTLQFWSLAALAALAWGTFFSLLMERPLLAVILGITAASIQTHLLAFGFRQASGGVQLATYLHAAPWQLSISLLLLAVDVVLGLRWLHGDLKLRTSAKRGTATGEILPLPQGEGGVRGGDAVEVSTAENSNAALLPTLLVRRDRFAMLGRLLWQHWRQSWSLMLVMAGLFLLTTLASIGSVGEVFWKATINERNFGVNSDATYVPMGLIGALMGCCVFLADQSRRQFRFFVEHNVPPRYVWFTRQFPWLVVLCLSTFAGSVLWLWSKSNFGELWQFFQLASQQGWIGFDSYYNHYLYLPPVFAGVACAIVAYAAGQFVSMLIRSGIIAAVVGVLLATILCGWVFLMHAMQLDWRYTILPIPLVLLWATWLRAPDWVRENTTWDARIKITAAVLVPPAFLCPILVYYRVHQVPLVSPGFNVAQYQSQIAQGLENAQEYQKAIDAFGRAFETLRNEAKQPHDKYLRIDYGQFPAASFDLITKANEQSICHFFDPARDKSSYTYLYEHLGLLGSVLIGSGDQLLAEGKLDAALDRYFAALQLFNRTASEQVLASWRQGTTAVSWESAFGNIIHWAGAKDQTPQRLIGAIQRLQAVAPADLHLDDTLKDSYLIARRVVQGDEFANTMSDVGYAPTTAGQVLWTMLMPWERDRALRVLNLLAKSELHTIPFVEQVLSGELAHGASSGRSLSLVLAENRAGVSLAQSNNGYAIDVLQLEKTTVPNLNGINRIGERAAEEIVEFEAWRRGIMLVLALQAYRLEHGKLPDSLAALKGDYFEVLPPDPYSGLEFRYFPDGLPLIVTEPRLHTRNAEFVPRQPGVWCTSPDVSARLEQIVVSRDLAGERKLQDFPVYFAWQFSGFGSNMFPREVRFTDLETPLTRGFWFPIPAQSEK